MRLLLDFFGVLGRHLVELGHFAFKTKPVVGVDLRLAAAALVFTDEVGHFAILIHACEWLLLVLVALALRVRPHDSFAVFSLIGIPLPSRSFVSHFSLVDVFNYVNVSIL